MKTQKFTLEFQAYEIEHIKKGLELLLQGMSGRGIGSNDIYRYTQDGQKSKKYLSQIAFTLKSIERQIQPKEEKCRIYSSKITFELFVLEKDLKEKVRDIWENPSSYWNVEDISDYAYYDFLLFLWIEFPNKETIGLADYAVCNDF